MGNPLFAPGIGSLLIGFALALPPAPHSAAGPAPAVAAVPATVYAAQTASHPPAASALQGPAEIARKRLHKPAPLQRLIFSARQGFSLRMVSNEEVTAELRNGAGRTLARASYTLAAGDWKLHPKNLPPGLYTVLLKTGAQLRAMRMKIDDSERGPDSPEWVLEKAPADSSAVPVRHGSAARPAHLPCPA